MKVTLYNQQRDLPIAAQSVKRLISCLVSALGITSNEIIVHLVSDRTMRRIHSEFFNDPSSTDCMSFPLNPPTTVLGEIFVCPKSAITYATQHNLDPYHEISRYLIHGLLHLIGYDDLTPTDKQKMRRKENHCLKRLGKEIISCHQRREKQR